jgi:hypothetical protein
MIADTINYGDTISDLNYGSAVRCAERLSLSDTVAQFVLRGYAANPKTEA